MLLVLYVIRSDVDECIKDVRALCGPYADCYNTPGSFTCVCRKGFEKSSDHPHAENAKCVGKELSSQPERLRHLKTVYIKS